MKRVSRLVGLVLFVLFVFCGCEQRQVSCRACPVDEQTIMAFQRDVALKRYHVFEMIRDAAKRRVAHPEEPQAPQEYSINQSAKEQVSLWLFPSEVDALKIADEKYRNAVGMLTEMRIIECSALDCSIHGGTSKVPNFIYPYPAVSSSAPPTVPSSAPSAK